MPKKTIKSRRSFLKVTGLGYLAAAGGFRRVARASALEGVAVAGIGIGGKGSGDIHHAGRYGKVVALCDVDRNLLAGEAQNFPDARSFIDYRELFAEMGDKVDAVTVGTADHTHAPITAAALKLKKHCYTQKPLTRTIGEARALGRLAKENGVCTQMGNQGSNGIKFRQLVAQIQAGALGEVTEVIARTNRPIWPQGPDRRMTLERFIEQTKAENADEPELADEEIAEKKKQIEGALRQLSWSDWLGPAAKREFWPGLYHSFVWRGWWDFGTGSLGDMGCHELNLPFTGASLRHPSSVVAMTSGHDFDSFPARSICRYQFPANDSRGPVTLTWYDASQALDPELIEKYHLPEKGWVSATIGTKGCMTSDGTFIDRDGNAMEPLPESALEYPVPPREDGTNDGDQLHKLEWFTAIWEGKPQLCWSNFPDHAGPLTEMVLLGNLAVWGASQPDVWGEEIQWDDRTLTITNLGDLKTPGYEQLIRPVYQNGYEQLEM